MACPRKDGKAHCISNSWISLVYLRLASMVGDLRRSFLAVFARRLLTPPMGYSWKPRIGYYILHRIEESLWIWKYMDSLARSSENVCMRMFSSTLNLRPFFS